jgi:hypothetical protein
MKILVTGDSHTGPLQRGLTLLQRDEPKRLAGHEVLIRPLGGGHLVPFPFFKARGDHLHITQPEYQVRLKRLPLPDVPDVDWYGVSAPLHTARVFRHEDWRDHVLEGEGGDGIPVSNALLGRLVDDDQRQVMAFMKALAALGLKPFAIEGPRPFRHHPAVAVVGAARVARIDRFYRERMMAWLVSEGFPVVRIPAALVDADGFMIEAMRKGPDDAHHGNEKFGVHMIEAMLAALGALEKP